MTITCVPDTGIPMPSDDVLDPELVESAKAACETIKALQDEGLELNLEPSDEGIAARIVESFAASEDQQVRMPSSKALSTAPPAAIVLTKTILDEFAHAVVERAVQIRHLVTNKLILESDNPDPKIRIRALELLGKISDVGLFTERSEVVVTHQSNAELTDKLRDKLRKLMSANDVEDAVEVGGERIDLAHELGLDDTPMVEPPEVAEQPRAQ
jgi:hypothetical protein